MRAVKGAPQPRSVIFINDHEGGSLYEIKSAEQSSRVNKANVLNVGKKRRLN